MKRMTGADTGTARPSRLRTTLRRGGEHDGKDVGKDVGVLMWAPEAGPRPEFPGLAPAEVVERVGALPEESVPRIAAAPAVPAAPAADEPRGPAQAAGGLAAPPASMAPPAPPVEPPAAPKPASSSPGAARLRLAALALAVALGSAVVTALVVLVPGRDSGTRTIEAPPTHQPTAGETTRDVRGETPRPPVPDPRQDQDQDQDRDQGRERDRATEPSGSADRVPTPPTTQRTRQPGVIADCGGKPLSEPASLLLACGDGGRMLHDLTWTGWGEPTATARGTVSEVVCEPSCVNGYEVRSPATVTVSGLAGGRYTFMRLSAPRSPHGPLAHYTLDAFGPTLRSRTGR